MMLAIAVYQARLMQDGLLALMNLNDGVPLSREYLFGCAVDYYTTDAALRDPRLLPDERPPELRELVGNLATDSLPFARLCVARQNEIKARLSPGNSLYDWIRRLCLNLAQAW